MKQKERDIISSYRKAIKVIESCRNLDHLRGANNYINNFLNHFSKNLTEILLDETRVVESEEFVSSAYSRLRGVYESRKEMLSL